MTTSTVANQQRLAILMYHSISDRAALPFRPFVLSPEVFRDHLERLRSLGYSPVTISAVAAARLSGQPLPGRPVALTFDDGFADFYTNALPLLLEYEFTATVFVSTAYVGGKSLWLTSEGEADRLMLSWEQLKDLTGAGIECAAHAGHHLQFDALPDALARREITHSKGLIERKLGLEVTSFAYPFGYYTRHTAGIVRSAGFSSACIVGGAVSSGADSLFELPRLWVTSETDADDLEGMLAGPTFAERPVFRRMATQARWFVRRNFMRQKYKVALKWGAGVSALEKIR